VVTDSNELLGQALGTCTLQRLLGRGGMGAVYLARQSRPRRIVAVKVLLPGLVLEQRSRHEFLARFRREADAIAALDHINIMPVYEYGEQGDIAFLVMPYVTGGTLREVLEKRGVLSLEEVVPIIEQAAAGLDCAHAQTIVHRDLKPGNIIFHADGRILLADFGLAKVLKDVTDHESSQGHLTSVGTIVGTPEYLSPEQGTGDTIDYRTDVYSLGVVLYQMLAGRVPFTGTSPVAVAIKHTLEQPPPITRFNPQVPKNVEAVVMKAMAKSPGDRFNSAGMFAQALRQAVSEALGDHFPSSLPASAGEQFTPVYPLAQEKLADMPPERHTEDDEMPTKITYPANDKPQETGTPTVLMEGESNNNKTADTPRLSEGTQNHLQALPTVITGLDATIADQPAPADRNVPPAQSPIKETAREQPPQEYPPAAQIRPRQPITNPPVTEQRALEQSNRKQESERSTQWDNVRPVQQQQMQGYPTRQSTPPRSHATSTRIPRIIALAIAILAIIIIAGSVTTFLINQNSHTPTQPNTITANAAATSTAATSTAASSQTSTPVPQTTPKSTLNPATPLPQAQAPGAGSLIYGTNYPGTCDPKGGTWQMVNIQAKCGPAQLELTNPTSSDAGAILTQLPGGGSLPSSYYIQVQVTLNTPNSTFGIYYHRTSSAYYDVMFNANEWISYYQGHPPLGNTSLNGVSLGNTVTVDIKISQGTFDYYINNVHQGYSTGGYGDTDTGGNIGLTVGQNSDVSFKNLAIYNLQ
jgi:serine/threonine protein kinase